MKFDTGDFTSALVLATVTGLVIYGIFRVTQPAIVLNKRGEFNTWKAVYYAVVIAVLFATVIAVVSAQVDMQVARKKKL